MRPKLPLKPLFPTGASHVDTPENRYLDTWRAFIQAKDQAVRAGEAPLWIKPPTAEQMTSAELKVDLDLEDESELFYKTLQKRLGVSAADIDPERGIFFLDWHTEATNEALIALKADASRCHFVYEPSPFLEGYVERKRFGPIGKVIEQIKNFLRVSGIQLPWKIAVLPSGSAIWSRNIEVCIVSPLECDAKSTDEVNELRCARTVAGKLVREIVWDNGFVSTGADALERERVKLDEYEVPASRPNTVIDSWQSKLSANSEIHGRKLVYHFAVDFSEQGWTEYFLKGVIKVLSETFHSIEIRRTNKRVNFRWFFEFGNRVTDCLQFQNFVSERLSNQGFQVTLLGVERLQFIAQEDAWTREQDGAERLIKLKGAELTVGEGRMRRPIGTLKSIPYPQLRISLPAGLTEEGRSELIEQLQGGTIAPNLTGEREMVHRLRQALDRIKNPDYELPNPQTRRVILDAALAAGVPDQAELLPGSMTWREIAAHSFLPLNDSQTRAVAAILLTPDLAMVQGPPGTGKSTAISQIIWHLVRTQQDRWILLTSETHTAVDNALEKLENDSHNLVRPIRFGSEDKLEREGARYALDRLMMWADSETLPSPQVASQVQDNCLCNWLSNIARRACESAPPEVPPALHQVWAEALKNPSKPVRQMVLNTYLQHVNVVGATTGSLGDLNSRQKKTRFYQQYEEIEKARRRARAARQGAAKREGSAAVQRIQFDVVVMDEASKAGPPELALAMIYARKAVVIGDHRQLPPLLDVGEVKSTLHKAGEGELAHQFKKADADVSQFERMFTRPGVQPGVVSRFDTQYRMHPDINAVIEQFYQEDGDGEYKGLRCGLDPVEADSPDLGKRESRYHGIDHPALVAPNEHLVWVEVDEPEMQDVDSRINPAEVQAVKAVLSCLAQSEGFREFQSHWRKPEDREVALITFYSKQAALLRDVEEYFTPSVPIRLQTVDKFQGMERNIVVVSLVRSDKLAQTRGQKPDETRYPDSGGYPPQPSLGFAEFPNRLNVALSRAKRLLIIVGNSRHFSRNPCYKRVFEIVQQRGRVVNYTDLLAFIQ